MKKFTVFAFLIFAANAGAESLPAPQFVYFLPAPKFVVVEKGKCCSDACTCGCNAGGSCICGGRGNRVPLSPERAVSTPPAFVIPQRQFYYVPQHQSQIQFNSFRSFGGSNCGPGG